ncbi:hypothetical protein Aduo_005073 [Ancylostoma duodenale]
MDFEEEPQAKTDPERISIQVVQQQGRFRRAIPCMPLPLAGVCCFFNVFIPGLGQLKNAVARHTDDNETLGNLDLRVLCMVLFGPPLRDEIEFLLHKSSCCFFTADHMSHYRWIRLVHYMGSAVHPDRS